MTVISLKSLAAMTFAATMFTSGAQAESFKIGIVAFASGPAAESQGAPTWQAAQMTVKELNAGALPKPYDKPGLGGIPI